MHIQPPPAPGRTQWLSTAQALRLPGPSRPSTSAAFGAPPWPRWLGSCCVLPGPDFNRPARLARPRPPHRSAVRLARSPESVGSFIEMLPHCCPSSRFQSPKHPPGLFLLLLSPWKQASVSGGPGRVVGLFPRGERPGRTKVGAAIGGARTGRPEEGALSEVHWLRGCCLRCSVWKWRPSGSSGGLVLEFGSSPTPRWDGGKERKHLLLPHAGQPGSGDRVLQVFVEPRIPFMPTWSVTCLWQ